MIEQGQERADKELVTITRDDIEINTEESVTSLTSYQAMMNNLKVAAPMTITFGLLSGFYTVNGIIAKAINNNAVQSYPLVFSISANCISAAKGILSTPSVLTGTIIQRGDLSGVGRLSREVLFVAGMLTPVAAAAFGLVGPALHLIGVDKNIQQFISDYYVPLAIASPALCGLLADQQMIISLGKSKAFLISGVGFIGTSVLVGYPLALGLMGLPKLGMQGIGIGIASSVFMNFALTRLYFGINKEMKRYGFYSFDASQFYYAIKRFFNHRAKDFLSKGGLFALQGLLEWLSVGIAYGYITIKYDEIVNLAAATNFQLIMLFNMVSFGLMQANRVLIAGLSTAFKDNPNALNLHNLRCQGNMNIVNGIISSILFSSTFAIPPVLSFTMNRFVNLDDLSVDEQNSVKALTQTLSYINFIRFLFDGARTCLMGNLAGQGNIFKPTMYNLFFATLLALTLGIIGDAFFDLGPEWIFGTQAFGLWAATTMMSREWGKAVSDELVAEDESDQELLLTSSEREEGRVSYANPVRGNRYSHWFLGDADGESSTSNSSICQPFFRLCSFSN